MDVGQWMHRLLWMVVLSMEPSERTSDLIDAMGGIAGCKYVLTGARVDVKRYI